MAAVPMLPLRQIPNGLCVLRMLLVIPVTGLLLQEQFVLTLGVFAIAAVTDGLDGFIAKRFGWCSELGKILDPLADKILLVSVFVTLAVMGLVPAWLAVVAVGRDVIITLGALAYNALYGYPHGKPTIVSKLNTLCQILFVLLVVSAHALGRIPETAVLMLGALVFVVTVVSGLDYVITYSRKAVAASRLRRGIAS
ncbi:MAG: CDP-alcohol phosphatidyltransferase family protein [Steroidobacteraceae bacterium]